MKIIIADDHALFRGGLKAQLSLLDADGIILEACDFPSLLQLAATEQPDLVVADLGMPGPPWREALATLCRHDGNRRIVVISASDSPAIVREAIRLGANGFVSKAENPELLMAALKLVLCGGTYVPPAFVSQSATGTPASDIKVTGRQREVLSLMAEGLPNKEIAYRLNLTEGTVKLHVAAVLKCLNATNRTQAVGAARRCGLLEASKS
ncbi:MAG: response regulator transcription factor [Alphaproteobacteria bacterium]|nr:response regulator transcription factor [Alphaproteobacteria bacterium]